MTTNKDDRAALIKGRLPELLDDHQELLMLFATAAGVEARVAERETPALRLAIARMFAGAQVDFKPAVLPPESHLARRALSRAEAWGLRDIPSLGMAYILGDTIHLYPKPGADVNTVAAAAGPLIYGAPASVHSRTEPRLPAPKPRP